jgi:hypothetical protein
MQIERGLFGSRCKQFLYATFASLLFYAALFSFPPPAHAAITLTQIGVNSAKGSNLSIAITVPAGGVPAGAVIIVLVSPGVSTFVSGVVDTAGNTYVAAQDGFIYYAWQSTAALVSGNTITVNFSTGTNGAISAFYATGLQTSSNPLDQTAQSSLITSTAPTVTTSGNVSVTGELIVGLVSVGGPSGDTFTQDSTHEGGFVGGGLNTGVAPQRTGTSGGVAGTNECIDPGAVAGWTSSGATATYAPTLGTSRPWIASIATFKPAPDPTVNTTPSRHMRLFEGSKIKLISGKMILYQQ